jgi:hypothetical protein
MKVINFPKEKDGDDDDLVMENNNKLYKLSDSSGRMRTKKIFQGVILYELFNSEDVYFVDGVDILFVWIGKKSNPNERKNALTYAKSYLGFHGKPNWTITKLFEEGKEDNSFFEVVQKNKN